MTGEDRVGEGDGDNGGSPDTVAVLALLVRAGDHEPLVVDGCDARPQVHGAAVGGVQPETVIIR